MTTHPQPITVEAREARRQLYRDRAMRDAAKFEVSLTCLERPDHGTCHGLQAIGPWGCLCPCHDKDAQ